jgi:signal transduction histidine kinase
MDHLTEANSFISARTKLTALYTGVILCIVLLYSIFLYTAQSNDYRRIVLQQDFGSTAPRRLTLFQRRAVVIQVMDLRKTFFYELIIFDSIILLTGGILSYFFADVTMQPINKVLLNQKNFLADASHELRTPLAAIQTTIEVVLRKEQKSTHVYKETLEQVQNEVSRMRKLIEELLLLSRIDMDQITVAPAKISLTAVTKNAVSAIKPLAQKKNISVEEGILDHIFILGEEERMKQLLLVLLDNAIKFTPTGGKVTVAVNEKPQLIIEDTGPGIPPEKQKDIFKRFYQADKSHTGNGAGLGLSIARSIIKLYKGDITVESTPALGSRFICTFPKTHKTYTEAEKQILINR